MVRYKNEIIVSSLPQCSFCAHLAHYDFKTVMGHWAYGCETHYLQHRLSPKLGLGLGQRLVATWEAKDDDTEEQED